MKKKKLILLVGESGCGKTTLAENVESLYGLKSIQSYTTRPKRNKDEKGHIFIDKKEYKTFDDIKDKYPDRVAETIFNGHFYFATQEQTKESDIYIIDPKGIEYFKEKYKGNKQIIIVYVKVNEFIRKIRMQNRGDSPEQIQSRIENDRVEFEKIEEKSDFVIANYTITDSSEILYNIYSKGKIK